MCIYVYIIFVEQYVYAYAYACVCMQIGRYGGQRDARHIFPAQNITIIFVKAVHIRMCADVYRTSTAPTKYACTYVDRQPSTYVRHMLAAK